MELPSRDEEIQETPWTPPPRLPAGAPSALMPALPPPEPLQESWPLFTETQVRQMEDLQQRAPLLQARRHLRPEGRGQAGGGDDDLPGLERKVGKGKGDNLSEIRGPKRLVNTTWL